MCGRYTLRADARRVAEFLDLSDMPLFSPRYNIAPTQSVVAAREHQEEDIPKREAALLTWGLIPSWSNDPAIGSRMINARLETAVEKPSFRSAFAKRRCLIVADGFYEWKHAGKRKQPYLFTLGDSDLFAFAGLWERWKQGEKVIESATILTTSAAGTMRNYHERMPVVLPPELFDPWLDPTNHDADMLRSLLDKHRVEAWQPTPVSTRVNNARVDDAGCVAPAIVTESSTHPSTPSQQDEDDLPLFS